MIWRHVVPNAMKPVLVLATIGIGTAIGYGASLSFLGLGTQPPAAEWGSMLASGIQYINNDWVMVVIPGLAVTLTVLTVTVVGRDLKRRSEGTGTSMTTLLAEPVATGARARTPGRACCWTWPTCGSALAHRTPRPWSTASTSRWPAASAWP